MEEPQPGNHYLLFTHLSISPELYSKLPIQLAPGVFLESTPFHAIACGAPAGSSLERHVGFGAWVYPGYGIGMGVCHACIKVDASVPRDRALHYAWVMAASLYIAKPLDMHIGGFFDYGTPEDGLLGRMPSRIDYRSNICLDTYFTHIDDRYLLQYDKEDLERAGKYFPLILKILDSQKQFPRPYVNLRTFFKAVLWERIRFADTIFAELFSTIDSFSGNPTHKHRNKISTNLSSFLIDVPSLITGSTLKLDVYVNRLQTIWDRHRGSCKHGYQKEIPFPIAQQKVQLRNEPEMKDLFDLMEIARVSIIKMLLFDNATFYEYCQIPVPTYVNDEDISKATRNVDAEAFFSRNHSTTLKDAFFYTDLLGTTQLATQTSTKGTIP